MTLVQSKVGGTAETATSCPTCKPAWRGMIVSTLAKVFREIAPGPEYTDLRLPYYTAINPAAAGIQDLAAHRLSV